LVGSGPVLVARADELEAELRLALGDVRSAAALAGGLPRPARELLLAKVALTVGDSHAAERHLHDVSADDLSPRRGLVRQLLLAATAIERGDPKADSVVAAAVETGRRGGFSHTMVTTAPQVTDFLVEHATPAHTDAYAEELVTAALEVRADRRARDRTGRPVTAELTPAERRVLDLLPTSTYRQMAAALYISPHTVKSHLRAVYRKLGAETRSEALQRAVDLRLL
jgi:LuxR family maltose regulon positive regulatory protein